MNAAALGGWRLEHSYAQLPRDLFTAIAPEAPAAPQLVLFNAGLARRLGLSRDDDATPEAIAALLSGHTLPPGAAPLAQAYAGHQFGGFSILGDGRAHLLGEQIDPEGRRWDIQLKGSGRTPYSRRGDGRAALGPMLREYIVSEAMAALGVPTTRSLAVVATGEPVYRERVLPGAVLTRVAASHLRVGVFQYAATLDRPEPLVALVDYALERHGAPPGDNKALRLLDAAIIRQAQLIADWMRVGFIHGVMNTDNMAISGETIDYGPCAFLDAYDPATVFSSIDHGGRYAFGNQPGIAQWNLARFAEALLPAIDPDADRAVALAQERLAAFAPRFNEASGAAMRAKLGLCDAAPEDPALIDELLRMMREAGADYTNGFRALSDDARPDDAILKARGFRAWRKRWRERRDGQPGGAVEATRLMDKTNPAYIPRNQRVEEALAAAEAGDLAPTRALLDVIAEPYRPRAGLERYAEPNPDPAGYRTFCGT